MNSRIQQIHELSLENFMQASLPAMMTEERQASKPALEQLDELGWSASQRFGGRFQIPASRGQDIKGLGQK